VTKKQWKIIFSYLCSEIQLLSPWCSNYSISISSKWFAFWWRKTSFTNQI